MAWLAGWNPWTWADAEPNRGYLTGLFFVGLTIALLRGLSIVVQGYAAGLAAMEAVTRLRRAVYHHAVRLGDAAVRPEGAEEAADIFTRQVEHVHDGLQVWLVTWYRDPLAIVLLLSVAFLTSPWVAAACVLFVLIVWSLAGQISGAFRRRGRQASRTAARRLSLLLESLRMLHSSRRT